jgi:gluconate 2-dehydrogenase gamma chain
MAKLWSRWRWYTFFIDVLTGPWARRNHAIMVYHPMSSTRRHLLSTCTALAAWPAVLSALQHAHTRKESSTTHFETLDAVTAGEIEAIAAQIIPSIDGPGAREAGVIYFIDRALSTFAADDLATYRTGMIELQKKRQELFPDSTTIAALSAEQQITLIRTIETSPFFDLLRTNTVLGFLGNPSYGGNRGGLGWQQIGFEDRMAYQPPFGYYDAGGAEKTGAGK